MVRARVPARFRRERLSEIRSVTVTLTIVVELAAHYVLATAQAASTATPLRQAPPRAQVHRFCAELGYVTRGLREREFLAHP